MRSRTPRAVVCLAVLLSASSAGAQEERRVDLHGFGSWAYGNTDANHFLGGRPDGNYRNTSFSLQTSANLSERLRIVSQLFAVDTGEGSEFDLDAAFAEWKFSDRIRLRAGLVNQPFGISAEVLDVGTLRPFLQLPQAFYGRIGLTSEAYAGVGVTGSIPLPRSWRLTYDVYGGGTLLDEFVGPLHFLEGEPQEADEAVEEVTTRDVIGGRILVDTSVAGLSFGASFQSGTEVGEGRRGTVAAQAEYLTDTWSARTEYGHETVKDHETVDGFYAELAYRIDPHWQVATLYGRNSSELLEVVVAPGEPLLEHEEMALGVNYWFSPEFVFKLAYHRVDGNRLATPALEDLADLVASGQLRTRTNLVTFGVQFSF
jgi:hypothetical protein